MSTESASGAPEPMLPEGWAFTPVPGSFDEAIDASGAIRPHFAEFFEAVRHLAPEELGRRWSLAQKLIRDNGVTYNVYGDPRGKDRPWELDPLPLILDPAEWSQIEVGLAQRARLLDTLLADLYGPQRTISKGLIPPELVLGNSGFLRPLHEVPVADGIRLHLYAADLARGSDGRFWIIGDRTQAPSGAGYTLENRLVISRMLSQAFRDCRVERLAPFFRAMREGLERLSRRESPRVVLLTPGPYNETYFEHAYLARYLGYTLAEGGDLTVRDRFVHLKTLGGLERVDVILRRLDDTFTDPLSLRPDSSLGIPGLVHAVRAGNVSVANSLGSGLLEMPALLAFLPRLCRSLLGEELRLPSVPSFFCGDEESLAYVLEHLPALVIKSAKLGPGAADPVFGGTLSKTELEELARKIRAHPTAFVAQERLPLSTAVTYGSDGFRSRHLTLRAFLSRRAGDYEVMPGGLTRFANSRDSIVVSMQSGGGSKDTWVLSSGEPSNLTLLRPPGLRVEIVRSGADLPSRVADHLFWIGRHVERADGTTRMLRSLLNRRVEDAEGRAPEVAALLLALENNLELVRGTLSRASSGLESEIARVLVAEEPSRTPRSSIVLGYRAASVVRDRISVDAWRVLSHLHSEVERATRRSGIEVSDALELSGSLLLGFSAFSGLVMENMTHGPGWRFLDIGRRIERGSFMVRLLRSTLVSAEDASILDAVLEVADSAITYRSRYLASLSLEPVLDLLITDETNPRSIAYQLAALEDHVNRLPRAGRTPLLSPEGKTVLKLLSAVRFTDLDRLARSDALGRRAALDELLGELEAQFPLLADQLTLGYLAHARPSVFVGSSA